MRRFWNFSVVFKIVILRILRIMLGVCNKINKYDNIRWICVLNRHRWSCNFNFKEKKSWKIKKYVYDINQVNWKKKCFKFYNCFRLNFKLKAVVDIICCHQLI